MGIYVVLYILAFKTVTLQEKKLAVLLVTKPPLQRGIKHCFGLFQGEEGEERRIEGELKLRMQDLQ